MLQLIKDIKHFCLKKKKKDIKHFNNELGKHALDHHTMTPLSHMLLFFRIEDIR